MNILLTGGAGFIGSNLADKLLAGGHQLIVLDNFDDFYDAAIKRANIAHLKDNPRFALIEGDIRDKNTLQRIFSEYKIELVVHIAARCGVRASISQPALYFDVNLNGTLNLLETMRSYNVKKMLFASSSSVYGNSHNIPFKETDPADTPLSPYAASKRACELLCYAYHHLYSFDIFCLRFFTVYGPRQRPEMAIHYFIDSIARNKPIQLFGDGLTRRDYTYIEDIVSGLIKAVDVLKGYEVINLGESQTVSLSELVSIIENELGMKAIIQRKPLQPGDVETTFADITKAKQLLGYNPRHSIHEGIRKFVKYYRETKTKTESA